MIIPWQRRTNEEHKKSDKATEALAEIAKQQATMDPMEKMRGMMGMLKEVASVFQTGGNQAPPALHVQQPYLVQQPAAQLQLPPPPPPGPPLPSEPDLPPNWQAVQTTNGTYYYNSVTRVSQYAGHVLEPGLPNPAAPTGMSSYASDRWQRPTELLALPPPPPPQPPPPPPGGAPSPGLPQTPSPHGPAPSPHGPGPSPEGTPVWDARLQAFVIYPRRQP